MKLFEIRKHKCGYSVDVFVYCRNMWIGVDFTRGFEGVARSKDTLEGARVKLAGWREFNESHTVGPYPTFMNVDVYRRDDYDKQDEAD